MANLNDPVRLRVIGGGDDFPDSIPLCQFSSQPLIFRTSINNEFPEYSVPADDFFLEKL